MTFSLRDCEHNRNQTPDDVHRRNWKKPYKIMATTKIINS